MRFLFGSIITQSTLCQKELQKKIQAPGLPNLEDLLLFLSMREKIPIYIGVSCAIGRGLVTQEHEPLCDFTCGELGTPPQLADLIVGADNVIGF